MNSMHDVGTVIPSIVLERIYDAAGDETRWTSALSAISEWIGASGAMYYLLESDVSVAPQVRAIYSSKFTVNADIASADNNRVIDSLMPLGASTPSRGWFFSQDHCENKFISRKTLFKDVVNPLGIRWVAGTRRCDADGEVACLAFQRPTNAPAFADVERARLSAITAHLGKASRIHNKLRSHALEAGLGVEAMNTLKFGVALLEADARVMYSNALADRLFAQNAVFKSSPAGRIALVHASCQKKFSVAIIGATKLTSTALRVLDGVGKPTINSVVLPVPAAARWNSSWQRPLAMLTMSEIHSSQTISNQLLHQLFALTPAECSLANWLLAGRSISEYAETRRLSIATARTHMKTILSKTGMRRQAELVAYLARLPLM